mgnify:CR=1 FL=1
MAIVKSIVHLPLDRDSPHSEADCTYHIATDGEGRRYLQIDTYGSNARQVKGKKSQSIRFSPEAIAELKLILARHNL